MGFYETMVFIDRSEKKRFRNRSALENFLDISYSDSALKDKLFKKTFKPLNQNQNFRVQLQVFESSLFLDPKQLNRSK